jgi:hypothetical protein
MNANDKLLRVINAIALSGLRDLFSREFEEGRQDMVDRSVYTYTSKGDTCIWGIDHAELHRLIFLFGRMSEWDLIGIQHHKHRGYKSTITLQFRKDSEGMPLWRAMEERDAHIILDVWYVQSEPKLGYLSINGVTGVQ